MKIFILCGGFGSRLDHEGTLIAKPMVRIGPKPILTHIIHNFIDQGYNDFVFCLGYKSNTVINYFLKENKKRIKILKKEGKNIKFSYKLNKNKFTGNLIYTGLNTGTGGRIKKAYKTLKLNEDIMMTYGDGLANVNVKKLYEFHKSHGKLATLTAVRPSARFGEINFDKDKVIMFKEKPQSGEGWVNGGFFVLEPEVVNFLKDFDGPFEKDPLESLCNQGQLMAYKHGGFWQAMDVWRDKMILNKMWKNNKAEWKVW